MGLAHLCCDKNNIIPIYCDKTHQPISMNIVVTKKWDQLTRMPKIILTGQLSGTPPSSSKGTTNLSMFLTRFCLSGISPTSGTNSLTIPPSSYLCRAPGGSWENNIFSKRVWKFRPGDKNTTPPILSGNLLAKRHVSWWSRGEERPYTYIQY